MDRRVRINQPGRKFRNPLSSGFFEPVMPVYKVITVRSKLNKDQRPFQIRSLYMLILQSGWTPEKMYAFVC